jgi:uncharacterized membrane protein
MSWIDKYLSEDERLQLQAEIANVEDVTSGEIRLSIREKRRFWEKLYQPYELAVRDFEKLGITNTKYKTGILIFIIFDERYFNILADEGINSKIPDTVWNEMEEKLKIEFRNGNYFAGIMHIIDEMGGILKQEFPKSSEDVNELPDEIVIN